jgi:hypothetical protein
MLFISFIVLYFTFSYANAGEVPFSQCPQELAIQQTVRTPPPDEWEIVNNNNDNIQRLSGIGISAGEYPTRQTGFNIPMASVKYPGGDTVSRYYTDGGSRDYWAVCGYTHAKIVLVQKIPENAERCEVKYRDESFAPDRVTIKCFDTPREIK